MRTLVASVLAAALGACVDEPLSGMPEAHAADAENARFATLVDAYLAWYHATFPTQATADGVHDHDLHLPRVARADLEGVAQTERAWRARLDALDEPKLTDEHFYDLLVLRSHIDASLLDLEVIRGWERNPVWYNDIVSSGLHVLATRSFATPKHRLAMIAERLRDVPALLEASRENLRNPPRVYTEMAIEEFAGTRNFIATTIPDAFAAIPAPIEFGEARKAALAAVDLHLAWLKRDLLPRSTGEVAIGEAAYRQKLLHEEMIDTPIDQLLARGETLLKATQEEFSATASRIDASKPAAAILRETAKEHPPADRLLDSVRSMMADLKTWAQTVCDVPPEADCQIRETPEFRRTTSFASMEIPGPFEKIAREAYYYVTLPDPSWPAERTDQHLSFYNRYTLPIISVHEAYPGHYVQFLVSNRCPSKVRRVFGCGSFTEGWAHYLEQVYADAGNDPKLKLHQLHMALLRLCRYIAGIRMHCRGMTREQAVDFFMNEGYQERANAEREARRGTADPTYLVYTLGKMEIIRLRDEMGLPPREFHNRLIAHGYPPFRVLRMILKGQRA